MGGSFVTIFCRKNVFVSGVMPVRSKFTKNVFTGVFFGLKIVS